MIRNIYMLLLYAVIMPSFATVALNRHDIVAAGITNTAALLNYNPYIATYTLDGYYRFVLPENCTLEEGAPAILINGIPINHSGFQLSTLNDIPFALNAVDSVVYHRAPALISGCCYENGAVEIFILPAAESMQGTMLMGNEVKDPGPYFQIPDKTSRNVDKIGIDYNACLTVKKEDWQLTSTIQRDQFYFQDDNIYQRSKESDSIIGTTRRNSWQSGIAGNLGKLSFLGGAVRRDGNPFIPALGCEFPAFQQEYYLHTAWNQPEWSVIAGGGYSELEPVGSKLMKLDLQQNHFLLGGYYKHKPFDFSLQLESIQRKTSFNSVSTIVFKPSLTYTSDLLKAFGSSDFENNQLQNLQTQVLQSYKLTRSTGLTVSTGAGWRRYLSVFSLHRLQLKDGLFNHFSKNQIICDDSSAAWQEYRLTVSLISQLFDWNLELRMKGIHYSNLPAVNAAFKPDSASARYKSVALLTNIGSGTIGSLEAELNGSCQNIGFYSFLKWRPLAVGSSDFEEQFQKTSNFRWTSRFTYTVNPRLLLAGSYSWHSSRFFVSYPDKPDLDATHEISCSITKLLFKNYLKATVGMVNLLNKTITNHPAGAGQDFTLYLKGEFSVPIK